jgi:hypothetical protein
MFMMRKRQKTLDAIFAEPARVNIPWADIEALLMAFGAERDRGVVKSVRRFLEEGGIKP